MTKWKEITGVERSTKEYVNEKYVVVDYTRRDLVTGIFNNI